MTDLKINRLYLTVSVLFLAVCLLAFLTTDAPRYMAVATPLLCFLPFTVMLALRFEGKGRNNVNLKLLSGIFGVALLLLGIVLAIVQPAPVWYISLNAVLLLVWLLLSYFIISVRP